jgi:hypothetical protein
MSDVNLDFTVSNNNIDFTVAPNDITITPTDIQLTFYNSAPPTTGGNVGELQYNNNGYFGGIPSANYDSGNLTFTLANTKITGGTNHYYLQTDGTGNLTWAVGTGNMQGNGTVAGANTQIQFNDGGASFGGNAGFTFDKTTGDVDIPGNLTVVGNISGNVTNANYASYAGNVVNNAQPNITSLGTLTSLSVSSDTIALGHYANVNITGLGVSIGYGAGAINPGYDAIAIGDGAGGTNQGATTIALGVASGRTNQGQYSIAIGPNAGHYAQGANSIAIGYSAGATNQPQNTIILNATGGANLDGAVANAFFVKPVRQANTVNALFYNSTTGEISFDTSTTANANYASYAGNVTTSAQPNITSLGTLTGLTTNGQITSTVTTGTAPFVVSSSTVVANLRAANATLANYATVANSVAGSNVSGAVALATVATTAGTVTTASQPNITSVGTLGNLFVSGNIFANTGTIRGNILTGILSNATQPNITSVGTLTNLSVTGNVVSSTGNIYANAGTVGAGTGAFNIITGSITTSSQANITQIGPVVRDYKSTVVNQNISANYPGVYNLSVPVASGLSTDLTNNFYIKFFPTLDNVGISTKYVVFTQNGGANTYHWLPTSPATNMIFGANANSTVNVYYSPSNPIVGSAKDMYEFTIIRNNDIGANTAYDVIVNVTPLV